MKGTQYFAQYPTLREILVNLYGEKFLEKCTQKFESTTFLDKPYDKYPIIYKINANIMRYKFDLTYRQFVNLMISDYLFISVFIYLLKTCKFSGYLFETPSVSRSTINKPFEFVLIRDKFPKEEDPTPYREYLDSLYEGTIATHFENLSKDCLLIIPNESSYGASEHNIYHTNFGHLSVYVKSANPIDQIYFWRYTFSHIKNAITHEKKWLSTHGHGVKWLHIRFCKSPKYYKFKNFQK